jgi:hypothetical protein
LQKAWSINLLKRIQQEIKRLTRMADIIPKDAIKRMENLPTGITPEPRPNPGERPVQSIT